jgi:hypothetical protein
MDNLPPCLNTLPKDILAEWLEEVERQEFMWNVQKNRDQPLPYVLGCISFIASRSGEKYWIDIRNRACRGEFDITFYQKYLK